MRYAIACIGANAVSIACVVVAGYLVAHGSKYAWIAFLAMGLLCSTNVHYKASE